MKSMAWQVTPESGRVEFFDDLADAGSALSSA